MYSPCCSNGKPSLKIETIIFKIKNKGLFLMYDIIFINLNGSHSIVGRFEAVEEARKECDDIRKRYRSIKRCHVLEGNKKIH